LYQSSIDFGEKKQQFISQSSLKHS